MKLFYPRRFPFGMKNFYYGLCTSQSAIKNFKWSNNEWTASVPIFSREETCPDNVMVHVSQSYNQSGNFFTILD